MFRLRHINLDYNGNTFSYVFIANNIYKGRCSCANIIFINTAGRAVGFLIDLLGNAAQHRANLYTNDSLYFDVLEKLHMCMTEAFLESLNGDKW